MKKFLLSVLIVPVLLLFAGQAGNAAVPFKETKLEVGSVRVYDFGAVKLHAYNTMDLMADECFLLETKTGLVAVESPSFAPNIPEWQKYVKSLSKPLEAVLISYHPAGGKWYGGAKSYATENAEHSMTAGAGKALVGNLGNAFGKDFITDIPKIDVVIKPGKNSIGGVVFNVTDMGDGYDVEIPAINSIYTHMLGANSHSILVSTQQMDAFIKMLERFKAKKYNLILSSHHEPEEASALDVKIAYVKKAKELAGKSKSAEEFISAMKAAYPAYIGINYLEMSAGGLFKQ